jgi:hypothetical protein
VVLAAMKTTRDLYAIYADACTSVTCMHTRSPRRPDDCTSLTCMHTLTTAPRVPTGTRSKCCVRRTCAERTRCTESRKSVACMHTLTTAPCKHTLTTAPHVPTGAPDQGGA